MVLAGIVISVSEIFSIPLDTLELSAPNGEYPVINFNPFGSAFSMAGSLIQFTE